MFVAEIIKDYAPDEERRIAANVLDTVPEHLTYAEKQDYELRMAKLEQDCHKLIARSMQHVGPVGDVLDFGATVASAGEAICQFILSRPLMNAVELANAKVAVFECEATVAHLLSVFDTEEQRKNGYDTAEQFLGHAVPVFTPLFEDLERHARKRFPHLAGPQEGGA